MGSHYMHHSNSTNEACKIWAVVRVSRVTSHLYIQGSHSYCATIAIVQCIYTVSRAVRRIMWQHYDMKGTYRVISLEDM